MFRYAKTLGRDAAFAITLAVGISGSIAVAQETGMRLSGSGARPIPPPLDVVIVTTVRTGPTHTGIVMPVQPISMSASVRTDDLNPQSPADRAELQNRIEQTAHRLCNQMHFQYPAGIPGTYRCREAVERTSDQVNAAMQGSRDLGSENP